MNRPLHTILLVGLAAAVPLAATGCRGDRSDKPPRQFLPGMDDQPRWMSQSESEFFEDGRTMRPRPEGTVAFGRHDFIPGAFESAEGEAWGSSVIQTRTDMLRDDDGYYRGVDENGVYLRQMPLDVTKELLEWGQNRYNIYCVACHGYTGDGEGSVGLKWSYPLPNFHDPKYNRGEETGDDGYLWWTALNGVFDDTGAQKMPGYSHALSERDAWAVVAYIRALQETRKGDLNDVSESEQQQLLQSRGGTPSTASQGSGQGGGAQ